jgi:hypothetical protein
MVSKSFGISRHNNRGVGGEEFETLRINDPRLSPSKAGRIVINSYSVSVGVMQSARGFRFSLKAFEMVGISNG